VTGVAGERTRTVSVRLSPAEHTAWVAAAHGAGRGRLGSWVRDRVAATLATGSASAADGPAAASALQAVLQLSAATRATTAPRVFVVSVRLLPSLLCQRCSSGHLRLRIT